MNYMANHVVGDVDQNIEFILLKHTILSVVFFHTKRKQFSLGTLK